MGPYDEGRAAAASGVAENPYAEGTYPFAEWSRGFGVSGENRASDVAFDEGRAAARAGQHRSANPYDDASDEAAENCDRWFAGHDSVSEQENTDARAEQPEAEEAATD